MVLSKAFDCVLHDFSQAELTAYDVDENFLCYTPSLGVIRENQ